MGQPKDSDKFQQFNVVIRRDTVQALKFRALKSGKKLNAETDEVIKLGLAVAPVKAGR